MRIISRRTLLEFVESRRNHHDHKVVAKAVQVWFAEAKRANWKSSAEVKALYKSASIVTADRVVFNLKGNDYRLVVAIDYVHSIVWIKWMGTHKDYDKIDVKKVEYDD
jgi:mRNA interferase HigB